MDDWEKGIQRKNSDIVRVCVDGEIQIQIQIQIQYLSKYQFNMIVLWIPKMSNYSFKL